MLKIAIVDDENNICAFVEKSLLKLSKKYGISTDIDVLYSGVKKIPGYVRFDRFPDFEESSMTEPKALTHFSVRTSREIEIISPVCFSVTPFKENDQDIFVTNDIV